VASELDLMRAALRRPLALPYHPLYRFYEGGSMSRAFRGLPPGVDDWWSEDWVGSCTEAGNPDPAGRTQGLSEVEVEGLGTRTLAALVQALPEEAVGGAFASRWGPITGALVKLLSPAGQVPLHAHPNRAWAREHLDSPHGKTEAWILLDTPGDGIEPAHAGIGFRPDVSRAEFEQAVARRDRSAVRDTLHRTPIAAGEVYVLHGGVPHYLGPHVSFLEIQEPSDHLVVPEWADADDSAATMGLGFPTALTMLDFDARDRDATLTRARQQPTELRRSGQSRETRLVGDDVLEFFDATRLTVVDDLEVDDGRFSVGVVIAGNGRIEGEFGSETVSRGMTFACAASLPHRYVAGSEPLTVIRCMGPVVA
jgi:mannose-6-phosphate isomerase